LSAIQALVDADPIIFHFPITRLSPCRSPTILAQYLYLQYTPVTCVKYKWAVYTHDFNCDLSASHVLSRIPPYYFYSIPCSHTMRGVAGRDIVIHGPYPLPIEVCGA